MPGMDLSETRLREVPAVEDLEKVERRLRPQADKYEINILQSFTRQEIVERLAEDDERLSSTGYTIRGNVFEYEGLEGRIDADEETVRVDAFDSQADLSVRDVLRIGGASTDRTMHDKAMSSYRTSLQKAGYDVNKKAEELVETAQQALEDLGYESFEVEIDGSAREAYEEVISKLE